VVSTDSCPSHNAITEVSTPASNKSMADVCLLCLDRHRRHYLPRRTMSRNFCLWPILRRKSPVGRDIVRPPIGRAPGGTCSDIDLSGLATCVSNSGAAKRVPLKGEAQMSGCALFSATIKESDRCWICSGDGIERSLEILPGPAITRGTCSLHEWRPGKTMSRA
jgi:hypothetical protein